MRFLSCDLYGSVSSLGAVVKTGKQVPGGVQPSRVHVEMGTECRGSQGDASRNSTSSESSFVLGAWSSWLEHVGRCGPGCGHMVAGSRGHERSSAFSLAEVLVL